MQSDKLCLCGHEMRAHVKQGKPANTGCANCRCDYYEEPDPTEEFVTAIDEDSATLLTSKRKVPSATEAKAAMEVLRLYAKHLVETGQDVTFITRDGVFVDACPCPGKSGVRENGRSERWLSLRNQRYESYESPETLQAEIDTASAIAVK